MTDTKQQSGMVPLNIWPVAQTSAKWQRAGRYVSESSDHPGKMLPSLAKRIVEEYSSPGDFIVDPMAGIGTTVIEGAALGRRCVGIDLESQWVAIARQNIQTVLDQDAQSRALARVGDAKQLPTLLDNSCGKIDLIATSPPYACDVAVIDRRAWDNGGSMKRSAGHNYSESRDNAGHARGLRYEQEMTEIYAACFEALRPGGYLVTVTKNMRQKGRLVDLTETTIRLAESVGFIYVQHNVALLCGVRNGGLVGRPSFWQSRQVGRARASGVPQHVVCHEDVLAFAVRRFRMSEILPLSVWPVGQDPSPTQRKGRYLPESMKHPGKMLPALARHAIEAYTEIGDIVVDPMCGIGTTLVEAVHLGRNAFGVELEQQWADIANANVALAKQQSAIGNARAFCGDGRLAGTLVPTELVSKVALVLTSPPYGPSLHGHIDNERTGGLKKSNDHYSDDRSNLEYASTNDLLDAFAEILRQCAQLLRPGGIVAITTRPWRRNGRLIDLPGAVVRLADSVGLEPFERDIALLCALQDDRLVSRASFFQLDWARKARSRGVPQLVIAHEDVVILRKNNE